MSEQVHEIYAVVNDINNRDFDILKVFDNWESAYEYMNNYKNKYPWVYCWIETYEVNTN